MATPASIIAQIDTQIATIIASPSGIASYKIGDKTVQKSQILSELRETRKVYQDLLEKSPSEVIEEYALDITEFGEDNSEYIGDIV